MVGLVAGFWSISIKRRSSLLGCPPNWDSPQSWNIAFLAHAFFALRLKIAACSISASILIGGFHKMPYLTITPWSDRPRLLTGDTEQVALAPEQQTV